MTMLKKLAASAVVLALVIGVAGSAKAQTALESEVAAAAGRAAGRVANQAVANAVLRGSARFKGPAWWAGADDLRLRGIRHAIFVAECRKVL
jgi:hypothetical protein